MKVIAVSSTTTTTTTTTTRSTTTTTTTTTSTSTKINLDVTEGSGHVDMIDISDNEFGSGMEIGDKSGDDSETELNLDFLSNEDLIAETRENDQTKEETEIKAEIKAEHSDLASELDGSGEVELIITLPDLALEGSGVAQNQGGDFQITRKKKGFQSGEDVFKALVSFLLPSSESTSLGSDDDKSFKDLFNIFAS